MPHARWATGPARSPPTAACSTRRAPTSTPWWPQAELLLDGARRRRRRRRRRGRRRWSSRSPLDREQRESARRARCSRRRSPPSATGAPAAARRDRARRRRCDERELRLGLERTYRALARTAGTRRRAHRARRSGQRRATEVVVVNADVRPVLPAVRRVRASPTTSSASRAERRSSPRRDAAREHVEVDAGLGGRGVRPRAASTNATRTPSSSPPTDPGAVAVVCDGVSLSAAPQVAAQVAAQAAGEWLLESSATRPADRSASRRWPRDCGRSGDAVAGVPWMAAPDRNGPSCTVVAATWDGSAVTVGWAGDSRAYWVDGRRRPTAHGRPLVGPGAGRDRRHALRLRRSRILGPT